ncbi:hypothetical protein NKH18_10450 [Streptomyces sp. M10(2022)]
MLVAELNEETGRATADEIGGRFVRTDVSDKAQVPAMADNVGRVENKTDEVLARGLGIGFHGPFWAMQAAFPQARTGQSCCRSCRRAAPDPPRPAPRRPILPRR